MKFLESAFKEILTFIVLAVLIVVPIRLFVAQPFVVEGESMHPTFESGDYLIVDELSYHLSAPQRGDVIIFRYPGDPNIFYIKRIIGLPGETVHIDHGVTTVTKTDGTTVTLNESYVVAEDATYTQDSTLGADQFFVMGDNRPRSSDSRIWGPLPKKNIMGRAFVRMLPANEIGILPGKAVEPQ
ncbi:MAG: signal peptidase signal peptidase [Parcubacteria group bacterium]|nr:signal peptidase signal peptidase [Parcubacteria group bacterium]